MIIVRVTERCGLRMPDWYRFWCVRLNRTASARSASMVSESAISISCNEGVVQSSQHTSWHVNVQS